MAACSLGAEVIYLRGNLPDLANTGRFIGINSKYIQAKKSSPCLRKNCGKLSLTKPLEICSSKENKKTTIKIKYQTLSYKLLKKIRTDLCLDLLPNLEVKCLQSYLLRFAIHSGGSIGWDEHIGIYGLLSKDDGNKIIAPLKFFKTKNNALNFLEEHYSKP